MDEIAEKVKEIQKKYGDRSVAVWKGEGSGFAQNEDLFRRFIHAIGSPNYFSNDTQCWAGRNLGYTLVHGSWPEPQFEDTKLLFIWGSNPPNMQSYWIQQINIGREKGAKLVVFDTRYSEIARQADIHVQMRPGTDCVVAYAIIKEIITQGLTDDEFIRDYTVGFDKLKEYAMTFTPEFVESETGVPYQTILDVVALIKERAPQMGNWYGTGIEHQTNGNSNIRAAVLIDTLVGACDIPGGMYYPNFLPVRELTIYHEKPLLELEPIGRDNHRPLYDSRQECNTLDLMDTLITQKPYPIKAMLLTAANPVLTNARSQKVIDGFSNLDLLVVKDLFLTETAKMADYILPAASNLEREELCYQPKKHCIYMRHKIVDYGYQDEYDFVKGMARPLGRK